MNRIAFVLGFSLLAGCVCSGQQQAQTFADSALPPAAPLIERTEEPVSEQDLQVMQKFAGSVAEIVHAGRFEEADKLASRLRSSKVRYNGGNWKLYTFYYGVESPWPGQHSTDEDWQAHINLLERWVAERPSSITARVALAQAYTEYGWEARGSGYANTVSSRGWKLLEERNAKARKILEDAAKLKEMCPEWFYVMQQVALAEGWSREDEQQLFERAIAFEPEYLYFYRTHAYFLLPKWNGVEGEVADFVEKTADSLGHDPGNVIYADLVAALSCCAEEIDIQSWSWPRVLDGLICLRRNTVQTRGGLTNWRTLPQKRVMGPQHIKLSKDWLATGMNDVGARRSTMILLSNGRAE